MSNYKEKVFSDISKISNDKSTCLNVKFKNDNIFFTTIVDHQRMSLLMIFTKFFLDITYIFAKIRGCFLNNLCRNKTIKGQFHPSFFFTFFYMNETIFCIQHIDGFSFIYGDTKFIINHEDNNKGSTLNSILEKW